jgi:hypothetical protein
LWILPCQITKCGQFKDSKWSLAQNLDFLRTWTPETEEKVKNSRDRRNARGAINSRDEINVE